MSLAAAHPHPRDAHLQFEAAEHAYHWRGERVPISVSGVWSKYFPAFDAAATIDRYFEHWLANPKSRYYTLLQYLSLVLNEVDVVAQRQAIATLWEANRQRASSEGTNLHAQIESHLNGEASDGTADGTWAHYLAWRSEWAAGLTPYRTEWAIYDDCAGVAGMIDSLWVDGEGRYVMADWKRCKPSERRCGLSAADKAFGGETGFGPCASLPNTAYWHYSLQQNLYAAILERCYGVAVHAMYLVQLHPKLPSYHCVQVPEMQALAHALLDAEAKSHR